jgi:hypothetical protein
MEYLYATQAKTATMTMSRKSEPLVMGVSTSRADALRAINIYDPVSHEVPVTGRDRKLHRANKIGYSIPNSSITRRSGHL